MYQVVWRYEVKEQYLSHFTEMYGSSGNWVELFKKSPHYIKTELFKAAEGQHTYVTIDFWQSKNAYQEFYEDHHSEIDQLDVLGDGFTIEEAKIAESL